VPRNGRPWWPFPKHHLTRQQRFIRLPGLANTIAPNNFYDITSGNNGPDLDDYAIAGYDLVTGLGSPAALGLVSALSGVSSTPDFTLAVSPSSQTVTAGNPASYNVTVTASGAYSGTVSLSVSGLSGTFNPISVTLSGSGSGSSTLTIPTTSTQRAGTYTLTITGTDTSASLMHSVKATLVVNAVVNHGHGRP
jgi:hypothetical protein